MQTTVVLHSKWTSDIDWTEEAKMFSLQAPADVAKAINALRFREAHHDNADDAQTRLGKVLAKYPYLAIVRTSSDAIVVVSAEYKKALEAFYDNKHREKRLAALRELQNDIDLHS